MQEVAEAGVCGKPIRGMRSRGPVLVEFIRDKPIIVEGEENVLFDQCGVKSYHPKCQAITTTLIDALQVNAISVRASGY